MTEQSNRRRSGELSAIDVQVGHRLRLRRTLLGVSQQQLADAIDLTFQQVQKYESGANRISASRLYALGRVLHVPVAYFLDDIDPMETEATVNDGAGQAEGRKDRPIRDPTLRRETLELVRAYYRITDANTRRTFMDLVRSLAPDDDD